MKHDSPPVLLLVEDDAIARRSFKRVLAATIDVLTAGSWNAAVEISQTYSVSEAPSSTSDSLTATASSWRLRSVFAIQGFRF